MRSFLFVLSGVIVMALAFWAYHENYRTQSELGEVRALREDIARLKESLGVLKAEWAYLNRPDRLRELAEINFDQLQLLPLDPQQFGTVEQVSYPSLGLPGMSEPVDTAGAINDALAEAIGAAP